MARSGFIRSSRTVTVYGILCRTVRETSLPDLLRTGFRSLITLNRVTRTTRSPADRAVASENCMMPFGPAGLTASGWPQLSRYAMAAITDAGMPVRAEALRKSFASRAPVIRSAPEVARGSRMMAKVCPWIIRAVRVASTVGEISVRSTPIPDNRCSGVKYSGRARSKGVQTSAVNTEVRREICTKRHSNVAHILLEYVRYG